jgi:D-alanine-D-alanine ligase
MMKKIKVAVVFGGRSAEHEVSLQSAKNVIESLNKEVYEPVLIGIDRTGRWFLNENSMHLLHSENPKMIQLADQKNEVALTPTGKSRRLINLNNNKTAGEIDVIFPVLHGPYGEDGTIQGLAKLANIPCVGAGILGSAIGMDKDIMKRLLRDAGIPVSKFLTVTENNRADYSFDKTNNLLGIPFFVKPANLGSSVGINKVRNINTYEKAIREAFSYDLKIIIEQEIKGREIECAVLGNEDPIASVAGEILPGDEFYSYNAKYINEDGAVLEIPAKISDKLLKKVQELAVKTFKVLECRGMARVDMFITPEKDIIINEINTIPGFTRISMYPKLWEYSGISYPELADKLISLAIEDFRKREKLKVTVDIK